MSLMFQGPGGSFERRWIVYAMLRDNVQHHLEGGTPSSAFSRVHGLGDALTGTEVVVPALELRNELEHLHGVLERPIADLAVSLRTRAAHSLRFPLPAERNTVLAAAIDWEPPFPLKGAATLGDAFGSLVSELLRITEGAKAGDVVRVVDS